MFALVLLSALTALPFGVDTGNGVRRTDPSGCPEFAIESPRVADGIAVKAEDYGFSTTNDDNGAAIEAALAACRRVHAARLVLKPGVYRCFGPKGIFIEGMTDFVFDGAGAELVFRRPPTYPMIPAWDHDSSRANFVIRNCRRMEIGNLDMDWDWRTMPLATCARVVSVHVDEKAENASYCDFELLGHGTRHPYYGKPFPAQRVQPMSADFRHFLKGVNWWHGSYEGDRAAKTEWLTPTRIRIYPAVVDPSAPRWTGPNERKFTPQMNRRWAESVKVGDAVRIAHAYYGKGGFALDSNSDFVLHDVRVFSCFGFGLYIDGTQTRWAARNVSIAPRDMRHPISSTADSVHFVRSCGKALFDNLEVRYEADDALNVHDRFTVATPVDERTLKVILERGARYFLPAAGDTVELREPGFGPIGWSGKVKGLEGERIVFDRPLPKSVPEEGWFLVFDRTASSDDIILRNCTFDDMENRVLVNVSNVTIENCLFRRTNLDSLRCMADYTLTNWCEGMGTSNVVVRNCTFEHNCVREIVGSYYSLGADFSCWLGRPDQVKDSRLDRRFISDILVENCTFRDSLGYFADLRFGTGFAFRNNVIEQTGCRTNRLESSGSARIERVSGVRFEGNEFRMQEGSPIPRLDVGEGTDGVVLRGNRIVGGQGHRRGACGSKERDVLDRNYLMADRPAADERSISRSEALLFRSGGDQIYGQLLRPNAAFGKGRPVVIFCHGFAGFTRMDDVAQALCRAGCVTLVPHHRGAWGSQGKYSVAHIIEDAVNLVDYAETEDFRSRYGTDSNAIFLCGYSMGGNTVLHAAIRRPQVRGVILQAPCDIAYCMRAASKEKAFRFLTDNGIEVLRTDGAEALYGEIMASADELDFVKAAPRLKGRNIMMATGLYDHVVPIAPLDAFWSALEDAAAVRVRKAYPTSHGFMGVRVAFAADIVDFILKTLR